MALGAALAAAAFVWLSLPLLDAGQLTPQWDEFIRLENAKRLWSGELPYRDYFDHTGPTPDLLYAGLFLVVGGPNAGAARLLTLVLVAAAAAAAFLVLQRRGVAPVTAMVTAAWFSLVGFMAWPIPHHHWVASVLGVGALAALSRIPLLAGALVGAALLASQTQGLVGLCAVLVLWVWDGATRASAARLVAGIAGVAGTFTLALLWGGLAGRFIDAALVFPFTGYKGAGGPNDVAYLHEVMGRVQGVMKAAQPTAMIALGVAALLTGALSPVAVACAAPALATLVRGNQRLRAAAFGMLLAMALVAFLPRRDFFHAAVAAVFPLLLCPLLLVPHPRLSRVFGWLMGAAVVCGGVSSLVNRVVAPTPPSVFAAAEDAPPELSDLSAADAAMVAGDRRLMRLHALVRRRPDATMLAAPVGAPAYFFGPRPATPYTLIYDPSVPYLRDADYGAILGAVQARLPDVVMFTTLEAERAFFDPPASCGPACAGLAAVLRDRYQPWGRDGATAFFVPKGSL